MKINSAKYFLCFYAFFISSEKAVIKGCSTIRWNSPANKLNLNPVFVFSLNQFQQ